MRTYEMFRGRLRRVKDIHMISDVKERNQDPGFRVMSSRCWMFIVCTVLIMTPIVYYVVDLFYILDFSEDLMLNGDKDYNVHSSVLLSLDEVAPPSFTPNKTLESVMAAHEPGGKEREKEALMRRMRTLQRGTYDRRLGGWYRGVPWDYGSSRNPSRNDYKRLSFGSSYIGKYQAHGYQFHKLLESWAGQKQYAPQVMKELVSLVKDSVDKHYSNAGKIVTTGIQYESCAVVGNSGVLLQKSYGALIDSHQMVIRLNNAKIVGFQKMVGAKTTLSFVNSHILHDCSRKVRCSCSNYGETVPTILYLCQVPHLMDVVYCNSMSPAPFLLTDPRLDDLCSRIARYYSLRHFFETTGKRFDDWEKAHDGYLFHYSSGMQAIVLALGMCKKVDIFGFGKLSDAKHHYHTNQKAELSLHDYEAEYRFYNDLANNRTAFIPFLNESGVTIPPVNIFL